MTMMETEGATSPSLFREPLLLPILHSRGSTLLKDSEQSGRLRDTDNVDDLEWILSEKSHLNIGEFIIKKEEYASGLGASCDVLSAWSEKHNMKVAVKRIRAFLLDDKKFAKRLAKEIRIWASLKHDNILPLVGYYIEGDKKLPNLVSEWMVNGSLNSYMKAIPRCSLETCKMLIGIASGLAYLHSKNVIHADLKSENVLISPAGTPLLADFGLSLALTESRTITTGMTSVGGSVRWMAPELFRTNVGGGSTRQNKMTDIWAFGMLAYELLTWKLPYYEKRGDPSVILAIMNGDLPVQLDPDPSDNPQVFFWIWDCCRACWSRDTERPVATQLEILWLLKAKQQAGSDWDDRAVRVLAKSVKTIEELNDFLDAETSVPVDTGIRDRLFSTRTRALDFERQAKAWLNSDTSVAMLKVNDALNLARLAKKEFNIPVVESLQLAADFATELEERCEAVLNGTYQHEDDGHVFEVIERWRNYAQKHLSRFMLPNLDALVKQLGQHEVWMKKLPWYCDEHGGTHGSDVLADVLEYTKPEDDCPPGDDFFTCICFVPVRPPLPGQSSDAVMCDNCFARFHGRCAANGGSCPFCDPNHWNGNMQREHNWHLSQLPLIMGCAPEITKHYSDAHRDLQLVTHHVDRLSAVIEQFLVFASQPENHKAEYVPQIRHYMRKLYMLQFPIGPNPENSFGLDLASLHRMLSTIPVRMRKRRRPKFVFGQDVDKDWRDGTRCICRGQTPYLFGFPVITCTSCSRRYHAACVCHKVETTGNMFVCPLCCLRKCKPFPSADMRVKFTKDTQRDVFIDVKACIETRSRELIRIRLEAPKTATIFIDLMEFIPVQPEMESIESFASATWIPVRSFPERPSSPQIPPPPDPPWTRRKLTTQENQEEFLPTLQRVPLEEDSSSLSDRKRKHDEAEGSKDDTEPIKLVKISES